MFNFFKKGTQGAVLDPRPPLAKGADYSLNEIVTIADGTFFSHKKPDSLRWVFDQYGTLSCVAHSVHNQMIYNGIALTPDQYSRLQTYRKRTNYSGGGMWLQDAYDRVKKGTLPYLEAPTPLNCTEAQANAMPYDEGVPKEDFIYHLSSTPSNALRFVNAGIAVEVFIYASVNEWSKEYVTATDTVSLDTAAIRHGVVLMPKGDFNENGVNWYAVHDSAKFGGRFLRYVSEHFLLTRCYSLGVALPIKKDQTLLEVKPTVAVKFGDRNAEVKVLQDYLIKKGYLGTSYNTGYYGNLTSKAVLDWQIANAVFFADYGYTVEELKVLGGRWFGKVSLLVNK